jgi:hypothetical protein
LKHCIYQIGPKFQTVIPNWLLICQRPFKVRKNFFHSINPQRSRIDLNKRFLPRPNTATA